MSLAGMAYGALCSVRSTVWSSGRREKGEEGIKSKVGKGDSEVECLTI